MDRIHHRIGEALLDPSTWASLAAASVAAVAYAPDDTWRYILGGVTCLSTFLGVILKSGR